MDQNFDIQLKSLVSTQLIFNQSNLTFFITFMLVIFFPTTYNFGMDFVSRKQLARKSGILPATLKILHVDWSFKFSFLAFKTFEVGTRPVLEESANVVASSSALIFIRP